MADGFVLHRATEQKNSMHGSASGQAFMSKSCAVT
jgi:hypothetical protein